MAYTYSNKRVNPISGALAGRAVSETLTVEEFANLPGVYGVQLLDGVQQGTLTVQEAATGAAAMTEVTTDPLAGQYAIKYTNGINQRGMLIFNVANNGDTFNIDYTGIGTLNTIENTQAIAEAQATTTATAIVDSAVMDAVGFNIQGLVGSLAADPLHDITISTGVTFDTTGTYILSRSATITKQLDASWAEGDNLGGLFSGSIAAGTEYYMFLIRKDTDGTIDAGFDTSITGANKPSGWTYISKPIHWVKTDGSSQIIAHIAIETAGGGIWYMWDAPPLDINLANTLTTSRRLDALSVITGYEVESNINIVSADATTAQYTYICYPGISDMAPSGSAAPLGTLYSNTSKGGVQNTVVLTNTSRQVASRSSLATVDTYNVSTIGFEWRRF